MIQGGARGRRGRIYERRGSVEMDKNDYCYYFHKFGEDQVYPRVGGPFRSNVREFLSKYAQEISSSQNFRRWQLRFRLHNRPNDDDESVTLNIVEEYMATKYAKIQLKNNPALAQSCSIHCTHCRVAGWGGHPVCTRRYHFIIRGEAMDEMCPACGALIMSTAWTRCEDCGYEVDKRMGIENELVSEDETHLLHGVVHANGFGHLVRVNGWEGGSRFLSGCDIMSFWDRLCFMIGVRKISVMDKSTKYGLDYRVLHALHKGHPWFGNWGYEFGRASFGITYQSYKTAVEGLSKIPLASVLSELGEYDQQLKRVVLFYYSMSKKPLVTLQDLICFIMELLQKGLPENEASESSDLYKDSMDVDQWAASEVNEVIDGIVNMLEMEDTPKWMAWLDLRVAMLGAKDPKLVEFVLTGLEGTIVGKQIVERRCTVSTLTVEYRLKDMNNMEYETVDQIICGPSRLSVQEHVWKDLKKIYDILLMPTDSFGLNWLGKEGADALRKLLDCKQFVKDYEQLIKEYKAKHHPYENMDSKITVQVTPKILKDPRTLEMPPPELLLLPQDSTLADLEQEAAKAFKDVYICLRRFQVKYIIEFENLDTSFGLMLLLGLKPNNVTAAGSCYGRDMSLLRTERGNHNWPVKCPCGAIDDDGERMIECAICQNWQHTRCAGIANGHDVPNKFRCEGCVEIFGKLPFLGDV